MTEPTIRLAERGAIGELVEMRSDFTFEELAATAVSPSFEQVSHPFVTLVDKVPRPIRENRRIAYLTNVYTRPDFRGRGIGAALIRRAQEAAREADVELMIVWPSDESIGFYEREGFERPNEPLVWRSSAGP